MKNVSNNSSCKFNSKTMNSFAIQGHKEKEIHLSNCDIKSLPAVDIKSEMKRSLKDCLFISFHQ